MGRGKVALKHTTGETALRHHPQRRQGAKAQSQDQRQLEGAGAVAQVRVTALDTGVVVKAKQGTGGVPTDERVHASPGFQGQLVRCICSCEA